MTEAEKFEFKFRLGLLYTIAVCALLFAIVNSSGAAGLIGFISFICAMEVRAEREKAMTNAGMLTTTAVVTRAHTIVDILNDLQNGNLTKEEAAEKIDNLNGVKK